MAPHAALLIVLNLAVLKCQMPSCSWFTCSESFPDTGSHCASKATSQKYPSSCNSDIECTMRGRVRRQLPPSLTLPPGFTMPAGTLPPGLTIPPQFTSTTSAPQTTVPFWISACSCCKNCEDLQCAAALPGYSCVDEKIAMAKGWDLAKCETDRCKSLPGQGPCLCCPETTATIETTLTAATTATSTTTAASTIADTTTTKTTTAETTTIETTTTAKTTTPTETTTTAETTTNTPPICPPSTCCSATYLEGEACTETFGLSKKVKKKFCSKGKMCTNSLGVFDTKCTCCRNCKEHKTCNKKKGKCVDPASVNWAHWNFDFCYKKNVKCVKRNGGMNCVCCGWKDPSNPQLGQGENVQPPTV